MSNITDKDLGWIAWRKNIERSMGLSFTKVGLPAEGKPALVSKGRGKKKTMVEGHSKDQLDLVRIAAVHEFGAPKAKIPQRSFIRSTFDEQARQLKKIKEYESAKILNGTSNVEASLGKIGEWLTNKIKLKIKSNIPPELKSRDGIALIDSGQLIQSITHVEVIR